MNHPKATLPPLDRASWITLVGFWAALGLLFAIQQALNTVFLAGKPFSPAWFVIDVLDWELYLVLIPAIAWLCRRFPITAGGGLRAALVYFVGGVVVSMASITMSHTVYVTLPPLMGLAPFKEEGMPWELILGRALTSNLLLYSAVVGMVHALSAQQRSREREVRASQLEARLAQAQLDVLRIQLNPHFLFNTLHAISTLMHKDVDLADRMVTLLSDLLRFSLNHIQDQELPLREELAGLDRYLEIERLRFKERLTVHKEIDLGVLTARVPTLLLQPLVENAIRHGIAPRASGGTLWIRAAQQGSQLVLTVEDDGPGVAADKIAGLKEGIGLPSTRARLAQLYGDGHHFEMGCREGGGFRVRVALPLRA